MPVRSARRRGRPLPAGSPARPLRRDIPARRTIRAGYSLSKLAGSLPGAYDSSVQKRLESGVWISSISASLPSIKPNSYLVSTKISPALRAISCPRVNTAIAAVSTCSHSDCSTKPAFEDLVAGQSFVMRAAGRFGRRCNDRCWQRIILLQAIRQRNAIRFALAVGVQRPQRRAGHAGDEAAHDHFDRQRFRCPGHRHVRVRNGDHVVGDDVLHLLEPPCAQLVEYLSLVRNRAEHPVKRRYAIRRDQDALIAPLYRCRAPCPILSRPSRLRSTEQIGCVCASSSRLNISSPCLLHVHRLFVGAARMLRPIFKRT